MSKLRTVAIGAGILGFVGHWVLHFAIAGALFAAIGLSSGGHDHSAASTGDKHGGCSGYTVSIAGTEDLVTFTADGVVDGTCIKSGVNMWGGDHSPMFANDGIIHSADEGQKCYLIGGIGTSVVTVTRLGDGKYCQGISHIDVRVNPVTPTPIPTATPPPEPTPTPTPTVTPVASSWSATPIPDASSPAQPIAFPDTGGAPACDDGIEVGYILSAALIAFGVGGSLGTLVGGTCARVVRRRSR